MHKLSKNIIAFFQLLWYNLFVTYFNFFVMEVIFTMNGYFIEQENHLLLENEMEFFLQKFKNFNGKTPPHIHDSVEILFIVKGNLKITCENREFEANEGEMFLFRSQTIHSVFPKQAEVCYWVLKVKPSLILALSSPKNGPIYSLILSLALLNDVSKICWTKQECIDNGTVTIFERMGNNTNSRFYGLDILYKSCVGELLLIIVNELREYLPSSYDNHDKEDFVRKLYDVISYINKHYSEDLTLEDCSKKLSVSYSYFSRKFKQITGKTFKSYLLQIRVNHAEKFLLSTNEPITEIATKCGFNSITYFSSMYKELKGITPTEARKHGNHWQVI